MYFLKLEIFINEINKKTAFKFATLNYILEIFNHPTQLIQLHSCASWHKQKMLYLGNF